MTPEEAGGAVREIGLGFLFAPALHPAMKYAQPVRKELKLRTVFNLLGPLANPGGARFQIIGAPSNSTATLMANALVELGTTRAFVVHGNDGLDEVSTTGYTQVWEVTGSILQEHVWSPTDFGLPMAKLSDLQGGSPQDNAAILQEILAGKPGPARDIAVANAAAGLLAGGLVSTLFQGVSLAQQAIDSGAAREKLARLQQKFPIS
jgi:anthranilate phosphoribosyltransferase